MNEVVEIKASAYTIPTETPEADGTIAWESTTLVLVETVAADGTSGLGYSYAAPAAAVLVRNLLAKQVVGADVMAVGAAWEKMVNAVRNASRPGIAAHAISAVDAAFWDLKARVLDLPLFHLLPAHRTRVPIYGSGGFTSYSVTKVAEQLAGRVVQGVLRVKMKIGKGWGRHEAEDVARVQAACAAIG